MSAWMILRAYKEPPEKVHGARVSLSMAMWFAAIFAPVQIVLGDLHGLNVLAHQPTKLAAIEGNWETRAGAPLALFASPDEAAEENRYEIAIPKLGSYILTHDFGGLVPGLKDRPRDERPPVWPVFWSFRIMVAIGFAMLGVGLWSLWLRWKGGLYENRWFLRAAMLMTPSGFGAVLFGWFTAEIGRQPYVVYGLSAHRRRGLARVPRRRGDVPRRVRHRLRDHLRLRQLLSGEAPAQRSGADRGSLARRGFQRPHRQEGEAAPVGAGREPCRPARAARATGRIGGAPCSASATEYEGLAFWLPLIWAALIAVAVAMYVVMDGFDLGVGILFTAARDENWRDRMMFSVAPIWDGNETWLILGGGGLLAVFHLAYAILMPALYVPILMMLIALVFRGVAFEFRFKADRSKRVWDYAFHYGSLAATFAQGVVLGAFVQGFAVSGRQFAGGTWDFLTPFSLVTGVALVLGYGLLGATWCVMKTTGELELWARQMALRFLAGVVVAMGARQPVGAVPRAADRGALVLLAEHRLPGAGAAASPLSWPGGSTGPCRRTAPTSPFFLAIALFLLGYLGLGVSLFPYIVPPNLTIWQAANTVNSQLFALVGFAIVMPLTFGYTAYAYWVFRGKVAEDVQASGYH